MIRGALPGYLVAIGDFEPHPNWEGGYVGTIDGKRIELIPARKHGEPILSAFEVLPTPEIGSAA